MEEMDFVGMMRSFLANSNNTGFGASMKLNPYVSAATTALGTVQAITGYNNLLKLDKKGLPGYQVDPKVNQSIQEADSMRGMGYTPQEMASIQDRLERSQATGFQRAADASPNLVSVIQAGINYADQNQQLGIGRQDAALRRDNIRYSDSLRKYKQGIDNMNIQEKIRNYYRKQEAYGQAMQTGINNTIEGVGMLTSGLNNKPAGNTTNPKETKKKQQSAGPQASGGFMDLLQYPSNDYTGMGMGELNFG